MAFMAKTVVKPSVLFLNQAIHPGALLAYPRYCSSWRVAHKDTVAQARFAHGNVQFVGSVKREEDVVCGLR